MAYRISRLIADGCHSFKIKELGANGQLYTIHAVLKSGDTVPSVHAFMKSKTAEDYKKVLDTEIELAKLTELVDENVATNYAIIVDYEKAQIKAFAEVSPRSAMERRSFHQLMAINRRRTKAGLDSHIGPHGTTGLWLCPPSFRS